MGARRQHVLHSVRSRPVHQDEDEPVVDSVSLEGRAVLATRRTTNVLDHLPPVAANRSRVEDSLVDLPRPQRHRHARPPARTHTVAVAMRPHLAEPPRIAGSWSNVASAEPFCEFAGAEGQSAYGVRVRPTCEGNSATRGGPALRGRRTRSARDHTSPSENGSQDLAVSVSDRYVHPAGDYPEGDTER